MIKKFDDFFADKHLYESADEKFEGLDADSVDSKGLVLPKSVNEDPFLSKVALIVCRRLNKANIGNFVIYHDVIRPNGNDGVWIYNVDDNRQNIVCFRNKYVKTISIFSQFDEVGKFTADVTYSTKKLGFSDMIDEIINDLKPVNVNEAATRLGDGYSVAMIDECKKWSPKIKDYIVSLLSGKKKSEVISYIVGRADSDPICGDIWTLCGKKNGRVKYVVGMFADAMSHRYPEVEGLLDASSVPAPVIATTSSEEFDLKAYEEEKLRLAEEKLEEDIEDYEYNIEKIHDIVDAYSHYVLNCGVIDSDDKSVMDAKGLLICGAGGTGKTFTLMETLKENNMQLNRDYVDISSGDTSVEALYNILYKFNGKLIIFDDSPNIFEGSRRLNFWKNILQSDGSSKPVKIPEFSSVSNYEVGRKTRQERYFAEIGKKSSKEREEFIKKRMKEITPRRATAAEVKEIEKDVRREWDKMAEEVKPLTPDEFTFNGVIVVIGNDPEETMATNLGAHWEAITDRFITANINPPSEAIWAIIKKKLLKERDDTTIADELCAIPREYIDDFIEEVENNLYGEDSNIYGRMTWRIAKQMHDKFGGKGVKHWKRELKEKMRFKK